MQVKIEVLHPFNQGLPWVVANELGVQTKIPAPKKPPRNPNGSEVAANVRVNKP